MQNEFIIKAQQASNVSVDGELYIVNYVDSDEGIAGFQDYYGNFYRFDNDDLQTAIFYKLVQF